MGFSKFVGKVAFAMKKNAPKICFVAGGVMVATGTVLACKETLKLDSVLDEAKETINDIHESVENDKQYIDEDGNVQAYDEKTASRDIGIVYGKTALKVVKMYAVPATLIVGGFVLSYKGMDILNKRYLTMSGVAASYKKLSDRYHDGIIETYGEDAERQIRTGSRVETLEETYTDGKGKVKTSKKDVEVIEKEVLDWNPFSKFFMEGCNGWTKDPEMNRIYLEGKEAFFNKLLADRGYVLLNEVYKELGIPETRQGHFAGWVLDKDHPDTVIRFDIPGFSLRNISANMDFVNGYNNVVLLNFNCDPNIFENGKNVPGWAIK